MKRNRWSHGWREWKKSSLQICAWSATGREMCSCRTKKVIAHGMDGIFPADTWNRANLSHRPSFVRSGRKRALRSKTRSSAGSRFQKEQDGKRFIVFLYVASRFSGELRSSDEGDVFWYPLSELKRSKELADGFSEMLPVFTSDEISEVFYTKNWDTVFC